MGEKTEQDKGVQVGSCRSPRLLQTKVNGLDFMSGCSEKLLEDFKREGDMNWFYFQFLRQQYHHDIIHHQKIQNQHMGPLSTRRESHKHTPPEAGTHCIIEIDTTIQIFDFTRPIRFKTM